MTVNAQAGRRPSTAPSGGRPIAADECEAAQEFRRQRPFPAIDLHGLRRQSVRRDAVVDADAMVAFRFVAERELDALLPLVQRAIECVARESLAEILVVYGVILVVDDDGIAEMESEIARRAESGCKIDPFACGRSRIAHE